MEQINHWEERVPHYYGDLVRKIFVTGGIVMIITLPFFTDLLPVTPLYSIFFILILGFVAGLISPKHRWVAVLNAFIAGASLVVFEAYAVIIYLSENKDSKSTAFFWINEVLALLFFFALYYSGKTLRGVLKKKNANISL
ncbi:MAG: hypothetical protein AAB617_00360 [Patescibacteria group bacterium]